MVAGPTDFQTKVDPLLLEVADVVNTTLDLDTTLRRVAELVRKVIDYEIFGILLLNEKTQELYFRFQVGYSPEVAERLRIKVGEGVTGIAAQRREAILVDDVSKDPRYISAIPDRTVGTGRPADRQESAHRRNRHRVATTQPLYRGAQAVADFDRFADGRRNRECAVVYAYHETGAHPGFVK